MKPGDLVIPLKSCEIHDVKEPTFFGRGRHRRWEPGHPALIVTEGTRAVKDYKIPKIQILLDGDLWWVSSGLVQLLNPAESST
jgi:hypothetical protein